MTVNQRSATIQYGDEPTQEIFSKSHDHSGTAQMVGGMSSASPL
jgi:hypothetical protein